MYLVIETTLIQFISVCVCLLDIFSRIHLFSFEFYALSHSFITTFDGWNILPGHLVGRKSKNKNKKQICRASKFLGLFKAE